jgi:SpoVK/Ycf46/Vps4 family AAA+-type ATPase
MSQQASLQEEKFIAEIIHQIKAGYQVFNVTTSEEERALRVISRLIAEPHAATTNAHSVLTWDCVKGLALYDSTGRDLFDRVIDKNQPVRDPVKAFDLITDEKHNELGDFVVVFRDIDTVWGNNPVLWRMIRNVVNNRLLSTPEYRRPVFLIGNSGNVPENIKSEITNVEFALPDEQMLQQIIDGAVSMATIVDASTGKASSAKLERNPELEAVAVRNLLGLNDVEAENAIALALSKNKGINHGFITTIREQKAHVFKKSEVLTYIPEGRIVKKENIAGYDRVFDFVDRRRAAYTKSAEAAKIDKPKGLILLGPPGTGKSIVAELISNLLEMPGYQMDVGGLLGSLVGESERRTRTILRQLQAEKGCVVILDEADKAFSGMGAGASGDSGTSQRVFGQILSFLTRQDGNTFVIMTMNHIEHLPEELLRPGRFDAIFYTDLPEAAERRQVFDIHFSKRGVTPDMLAFTDSEWKIIVNSTADWSHAEIEAAVIESRYVAFQRDSAGVPTYEELLKTIGSITPSTKRNPKSLENMRKFCKEAGQPVTTPSDNSVKMPVKRSRQVVS